MRNPFDQPYTVPSTLPIGQVLRHQSLQTTAIYTRVDIEQLRELAAPWPTLDSGGAGR
jgi:hypothetical protein